MVKPVPDGYRNVTPYLAVRGAADLVRFLGDAFGGRPRGDMMTMPDGTIGHAEIEIGDSIVMAGETPDEPVQAMLHLYVEDCDAVYRKALDAGAEPVSEPSDQFYGDRSGKVRDKWGNQWYISTHVEDVPPDEMRRRAQERFSSGT